MAVVTLDTFTFPENVVWTDEDDWSPVEGSVTTLLTGKPLFQTSSRSGGRPITLQSFQRNQGWSGLFTRAQFVALKAMRDAPDIERTLTIGAQVFKVRFDREAAGFGVEKLAPVAAGEAQWPWRIYPVTARFITTE